MLNSRLLQHHSSKASILRCSIFFIVQLSQFSKVLQERGSPCAPWGALETSEEGGRRGASSPGCSRSRWPGTAGGGARVSVPHREQGRRGWSLSAGRPRGASPSAPSHPPRPPRI